MGRQWFLKAQYATGGGGGSGHIIVDDGGYALTQRSKMQFNGTYSEDNSTDGVTEVNITRTMTRSEFELLSNDEKKGLINVIDETSGVDGKFQPVIYSEEEREIGVWKDGKPLYEKTITGTTNSSNLETQVNHGISNLDTVVSIEGSIRCGTQWQTFIEHSRPSNEEYTRISDTIISIVSTDADWRGKPFHFTLRYTKTTDNPGSGKWTPQGVPAIHYSTEEQVIGTWVDGATLYEKTIYKSSITLAMSSITAVEDLTSLNIDTFVGCEMVKFIVDGNLSITDGLMEIYYNSTTKNLIGQQRYSDRNITGELSLTIRYTKSST